jgi:flagellar biosynthesis/type III secretory pathway protein FliH
VLNLSNKRVEFNQVPSDFRLAAQDIAAGINDLPNQFGIKEIQRRAFERGVAVERAKYSTTLSELLSLVKAQAISIQEGREADRKRIEDFAVRLALQVAEKLTRSIVDAESHNVVAMVKDMMREVDSETKSKGITLRLNPRDHAAVVEAADATQISLIGVDLMTDPATPLGSPTMTGGDTEYYADMAERLTEIRNAMIEESADASS